MTVNKKRQTCLSEEYYASEDSQNYNYQLKKSVVYLFCHSQRFQGCIQIILLPTGCKSRYATHTSRVTSIPSDNDLPDQVGKWQRGRGGERSVEKSGFGERKLARGIVSSIPIVHPRTPNQPEGEEIKRARKKGGQTSFRSGILLSPSYTFDCD